MPALLKRRPQLLKERSRDGPLKTLVKLLQSILSVGRDALFDKIIYSKPVTAAAIGRLTSSAAIEVP